MNQATQDLEHGLAKAKKAEQEAVVGIVTTPRANVLASAETEKPVKANPSACPKPERHLLEPKVAKKPLRQL